MTNMVQDGITQEDVETVFHHRFPTLAAFESAGGSLNVVPMDAEAINFVVGIRTDDVVRVCDSQSGSVLAQRYYFLIH